MLPLGCLPLWGREGVTLISGGNIYELLKKTGFLQTRIYHYV